MPLEQAIAVQACADELVCWLVGSVLIADFNTVCSFLSDGTACSTCIEAMNQIRMTYLSKVPTKLRCVCGI